MLIKFLIYHLGKVLKLIYQNQSRNLHTITSLYLNIYINFICLEI